MWIVTRISYSRISTDIVFTVNNDTGILYSNDFVIIFSTVKIASAIRERDSSCSTSYCIPNVNVCTFNYTNVFLIVITFDVEPLTIIIRRSSAKVEKMLKTRTLSQAIGCIRKSVVALTDLTWEHFII